MSTLEGNEHLGMWGLAGFEDAHSSTKLLEDAHVSHASILSTFDPGAPKISGDCRGPRPEGVPDAHDRELKSWGVRNQKVAWRTHDT